MRKYISSVSIRYGNVIEHEYLSIGKCGKKTDNNKCDKYMIICILCNISMYNLHLSNYCVIISRDAFRSLCCCFGCGSYMSDDMTNSQQRHRNRMYTRVSTYSRNSSRRQSK